MTLLKPALKQRGRYQNPVPTEIGGLRLIFKILPQYLTNRAEVEPKYPLGPFYTDPRLYAMPPATGLRITWFGHSSSLIELDGYRILLDPVWEQRASPFQFMGPKRFFQPTLQLADLPPLDAIVISHDHYDHLGAQTVAQLASLPANAKTTWITSLGVGQHLRRFGVPAARIVELNWTQSTQLRGLTITAWPARHFSGRSLHNRFTTLWSSFVLEGPQHRVFYGADSGWWEGFSEIAAQYPGFDLTMLEIGAYNSLWAGVHLGPDNAARAFAAMSATSRPGLLMPIHWGLFNLALHAWRQPVERILQLSEEQSVPLWLPEPGLPSDVVTGAELRSHWWK